MNSEYIDFDQAVEYLNTTASTMYKWLQAGKIPGHKLGRQWRFSKNELDSYLQKSNIKFNENTIKEIILAATEQNFRTVYITTVSNQYQIIFKNNKSTEIFKTVSQAEFLIIKEFFNNNINNQIYCLTEKNTEKEIQIKYSEIKTVSGYRVTLNIWIPEKDILPIDKITQNDETLKIFYKWSHKRQGLFVISGTNSSATLTTIYSLLNEFSNNKNIVFTIEEKIQMMAPQINQIELANLNEVDLIKTINQVCESDADVVFIKAEKINKIVYEEAANLVNQGYVVVLQQNENAVNEVEEQILKNIKIDSELIHIAVQKLVSRNGKIQAEYSFKK